MNQSTFWKIFLLVLLFAFIDCMLLDHATETGKLSRLNSGTMKSAEFRAQIYNSEILDTIEALPADRRGQAAGIYLLESKFGYDSVTYSDTGTKKWQSSKAWTEYKSYCNAIWNDITYFPVPVSTDDKELVVTFTDSWMGERNYGGKRSHEGTDIMAGKNVSGLYPIVSMTDGVVSNKGWLEKGGYRIGITSPSGGYFYYAHLSSYANIEEGDTVKAGQLLGFMGDTGYGEEGTTGKFDVHLHVGIYIFPGNEEISVNPYWILKFLENHKLNYAYS